MDLGHNKGQKRAKCHGHIDGRPSHTENGLFWFLGAPVAKYGWIIKKLLHILSRRLSMTYVSFISKFWFLWCWRAIFVSAGCGRPHPADTKIARQRHKNQNFEKNGTYIKDSVALSVPTNFFDNPTKFGDRIKQKPKKGHFRHMSAGHQYARCILLFLTPDLVPDNLLCMNIEDNGSI